MVLLPQTRTNARHGKVSGIACRFLKNKSGMESRSLPRYDAGDEVG